MPKTGDFERAAKELLDERWDGILPVDPVRIAKSLGVEVLDVQLDEGVSGALVKRAESRPSILLNASDAKTRKRFSAAHELGHFIRRANQPGAYEYVDYRDERSATGTDAEERFANGFAAAFVMPAKAVKAFYGQRTTIFELAQRFGVSEEAMSNRIDNLGLTR